MCMAMGSGLLAGSLASCASALQVYKTTSANNQVTVPLSLFTNSDFLLVQPQNMFYGIGLKKEKDATYTALLLRCTHADNQLTPTGNGFSCSLHGSTFDKEGRVTKGPAEHALKRYPTEVVAGQVIIHLD
jgi:Rieske Fe-S protein